MVCAPSSERNRRLATTLVNASLLPELQTLPTSKPRLQHWPQHGSSCPLFAGTGEPAKRSFSRRTLRLTEAESSACSQSLAENETMCSTRCDEHPPRRFHRFVLLLPLRTCGGGSNSRRVGKDRGGRKPRRGSSLSRSTCSPAQRATTWICGDSANTACFPTREGMALSTPRINSRGCRQPCTGIGFLLAELRLRVFLISLSAGPKYEDVLTS